MQKDRWIYRIFAIAVAFNVSTAGAQQISNQTLTADDLELEERITSLQATHPQNTMPKGQTKLSLENLQKFWSLNEKAQLSCQDGRKVLFAEKYVLTYDEKGQPCRIYDLSFPNLMALTTKKQLLQIPMRKMTSRDYIDALDQNWEAIQQRNRQFALRFNPRAAAQTSFVGKLKFKVPPRYVFGSQVGSGGLPSTFSLADLQLQKPFALSEQLQADFQNLMQRLENQGTSPLYQQLAEKPERLLQAVKFEWNDLDKVYNVILDGRFLPFVGPVEVLSFQEQYRAPVEQLTRQILGEVLSQLARLIPDPTVQAVVEVVIDDVFEQIDLLYRYQTLRLEQALTTLKNSALKPEDYRTLNNRAVNILYGQRADFISSFILAAAQGQAFDWYAIEKLGSTSRYNIEKQRKIMMSKMHSRLVLEKKCETQIINDYFANCLMKGQKVGAYSLISEQTIPFKSFGAPLVYQYQRPSTVTLIRGGMWILSAGLRIVGLPLSRQITFTLNNYIKGYMHSGILDEALLQSHLLQMNSRNELSQESKLMMNWMFIQNLNPFLPKSLQGELKVIESNKRLMGKLEEPK
jgi:hypothetical protein